MLYNAGVSQIYGYRLGFLINRVQITEFEGSLLESHSVGKLPTHIMKLQNLKGLYWSPTVLENYRLTL